jgi:hypothetical protein
VSVGSWAPGYRTDCSYIGPRMENPIRNLRRMGCVNWIDDRTHNLLEREEGRKKSDR